MFVPIILLIYVPGKFLQKLLLPHPPPPPPRASLTTSRLTFPLHPFTYLMLMLMLIHGHVSNLRSLLVGQSTTTATATTTRGLHHRLLLVERRRFSRRGVHNDHVLSLVGVVEVVLLGRVLLPLLLRLVHELLLLALQQTPVAYERRGGVVRVGHHGGLWREEKGANERREGCTYTLNGGERRE